MWAFQGPLGPLVLFIFIERTSCRRFADVPSGPRRSSTLCVYPSAVTTFRRTSFSTLKFQIAGWKQTSPRCRSRPQTGSRTSPRCRTRIRLETNISTLPYLTSDWKRTSRRCRTRPQAGNKHLHATVPDLTLEVKHLDDAVPDIRLETNISTLPYQTSDWKRTSRRCRTRPQTRSRTSPRCRSRPQTGSRTSRRCRTRPQTWSRTSRRCRTRPQTESRTSPCCRSRLQAGNEHLYAAVQVRELKTATQIYYTVLYTSCLQSRPDTKHILKLKKQVCLKTQTAGMSNET